jgi:hypothetical protein
VNSVAGQPTQPTTLRARTDSVAADSRWFNLAAPTCSQLSSASPCDPRKAPRALKAAAKRADAPSTIGLHTLRSCDVVLWRAAQSASETFGHASVPLRSRYPPTSVENTRSRSCQCWAGREPLL